MSIKNIESVLVIDVVYNQIMYFYVNIMRAVDEIDTIFLIDVYFREHYTAREHVNVILHGLSTRDGGNVVLN